MKTIVALLTLTLLLTGCATTESDAGRTPPSVGMTKSQVRAKYGDPDSVYSTPNGESWTYDFAAPRSLLLIPGYGASQMFNTKKNNHLFVVFRGDRVKTYNFGRFKSNLEQWTQ